MSARIDAVGAHAGIREGEIDLHDPPLAPQILDQQGEPGLHSLADIAAALPEEGVLPRLLADRRAAADDVAAARVAPHRRSDRILVETPMRTEFAVLGGDHGADHV